MNDATIFKPITDATDPRIIDFLAAWHENGRASFEKSYPNLNYDRDYVKTAHNRRKYIGLDDGNSGSMMLEKTTGKVYGIKGYGQIHRGHLCGDIEALTGVPPGTTGWFACDDAPPPRAPRGSTG